MEDSELLFFDTFSHESNEDLNLDLVQFPRPVYISEVRIIPLGARVQADFPGGVRLGATNPSSFHIEFFVNDLLKQGASAFFSLGNFNYNQNDCINLDCTNVESTTLIPTDGLVLRGWYTTITLAVYGTLAKIINNNQILPPHASGASIIIPVQPAAAAAVTVTPPSIITSAAVPIQITGGTEKKLMDLNPSPTEWQPPTQITEQHSKEIQILHSTNTGSGTGDIVSVASSIRNLEMSTTNVETNLVKQINMVPAPLQQPQQRDDIYISNDPYNNQYESQKQEQSQTGYYSSKNSDSDSIDRSATTKDNRKIIEDNWAKGTRSGERIHSDGSDWDNEGDSHRRSLRRRSRSYERSRSRSLSPRSRGRSRNYSRSSSRDRSDYRCSKRDRSDYRSIRNRNRGKSYERNKRDRSREHDRRSSDRDRERELRERERDRDRERERERERERDHERKRPRTPPSNSPRRPRTPIILDDQIIHDLTGGSKYHEKGQPIRVIEHGGPDDSKSLYGTGKLPNDTQLDAVSITVDDDVMSPQAEPFEPILSDEEIGDENDLQYDLDYDVNDTEDTLKHFSPYNGGDLQNFDEISDTKYTVDEKDNEFANKILQKFKLKMENFTFNDFTNYSYDVKEMWVHSAEQFIQALNHIHNREISKRYLILSDLLHPAKQNLSLLIVWIKIGLNYDYALSQPQPGYKIRHIKVGVRLIELLGSSTELFQILINTEHFDVFNGLFDLYDKDFMALSIKLMIVKAIDSCLDTKIGMDWFVKESPDVSDDVSIDEDDQQQLEQKQNFRNGYNRLIAILNRNPLTRIKFVLKSVMKKIHLYESLNLIRDFVTKWFILDNDMDQTDLPNRNDEINLLKSSLEDVLTAYTIDELNYAQPKRYLPVSTKFEIKKDNVAAKCTAASFYLYFRLHALLESLLLLLVNQVDLPQNVYVLTIEILTALIRNGTGIEYLYGNIQTTSMIVKCLLHIQHTSTDDADGSGGGSSGGGGGGGGGGVVEAIPIPYVPPPDESINQQIGYEIFYKLKCKYFLDASMANDQSNSDDLFDNLHSIYSLICDPISRIHVINFFSMNNNILPLLNLLTKEKKSEIIRQQSEIGVGTVSGIVGGSVGGVIKCKSPIINYIVDILDFCVRYCKNLEFLIKYGNDLVNLVKSFDIYETSVSSVLQEMAIYLKPLEFPNIFSYDDINSICDLIKRNLEFTTTFPGDLIMSLKILKYLTIPITSVQYSGIGLGRQNFLSINNTIVPSAGNSSSGFTADMDLEHTELNYKYVVLQFYSADGVNVLTTILDKINNYFEQPNVHSSVLATNQGILTVQLLLPTIQILRKMLTYVIKCRNTEYKDLTQIEHLLKTYNLMFNIPFDSIIAYTDAKLIQEEIIKTLLAYTQPSSVDGLDTETVHKSLWTLMLGDLIKYILYAPYTFMSGLLVLSELLPIPLPVQTYAPLTDQECSRLITERQLWSAHLHPKTNQLIELIQTMCTTNSIQLLTILTRVCLQLADLAPNMSMIVSKSILDLILNEIPNCQHILNVLLPQSIPSTSTITSTTTSTTTSSSTATTTSSIPLSTSSTGATTITTTTITNSVSIASTGTTSNTTSTNTVQTTSLSTMIRLLNFLSNLLNYPSVKVSVLPMLTGKIMDFFSLALTTATIVNKTVNIQFCQMQEVIHTILQNLLDIDIRMISSSLNENKDYTIACSIPPKDILPEIVNCVIDNLLLTDVTVNCQLAALKTLMILTEYNYTLYHIRCNLEKKKDKFLLIFNKFLTIQENDIDLQNLLINLIEFLQLLLKFKVNTTLSINDNLRTINLSPNELMKLLQWKPAVTMTTVTTTTTETIGEDDVADDKKEHQQQHVLIRIKNIFDNLCCQSMSIIADNENNEKSNIILMDILNNINNLINIFDEEYQQQQQQQQQQNTDQQQLIVDQSVMSMDMQEPQFLHSDGILIQYTSRAIYKLITDNQIETLETNYWLNRPSPVRDECLEKHYVPCDLNELTKSCLPSDINIISECKRLLHLSASPQSNRERTTTAPCFRTRRVEVEPTTGRPEKKIYVTRGRGFSRTPPTRGDLFRSRPPNTSRPPSLHVDDFLALETCGAQPTGPTGYNKLSREIISIRGTRVGRVRGVFTERGRPLGQIGVTTASATAVYRQVRRTNSPLTWPVHVDPGGNVVTTPPQQHFRTATAEPVVTFSPEYGTTHFGSPMVRGRILRGAPRIPRSFTR